MSSAATATQTQVPAGTWTVDPTHSKVAFEIRHMGVSTFASQFGSFSATLTGGDQPALEGTVDVESIEAGDPQLHGHLLSPDFFDLEREPKLSFRSSSIEVGVDGAVELRGTLSIKGVEREVTAHGRYAHVEADIGGNEKVGLVLEATVDRREFGLDWQAELPSGDQVIEWDVQIRVALEFFRAEA